MINSPQFLAMLRKRKSEAWELLHNSVREELFSYIYKIYKQLCGASDSKAAEDILQETFKYAKKNIKHCKKKIESWLKEIALSKTLNSDLFLTKLKNGDEPAWAGFHSEITTKIRICIIAILKENRYRTEDIEDLLQDTFCNMFQNISKFRRDGNVESYAYAIARNVALNFLRIHNLEKRTFVSREDSLDTFVKDTMPDQLEHLSNKDLWEKAKKLLPPMYRVLIIMRFEEGLNYEEIAKKLRVSKKCVSVRLTRARKMLKQIILDLL